jgi:hypothetical protein
MKEFDDDFVFTELCSRVGLPYPPPPGICYEVDAGQWTLAEEKDFREWLVKYCNSIPKIKRRGKVWLEKALSWFILQYSWRYKE